MNLIKYLITKHATMQRCKIAFIAIRNDFKSLLTSAGIKVWVLLIAQKIINQ